MYHIIVNPASRSGRGRMIWKEVLKPTLDERQVPYQVYFSEKPGDISRLAAYITSHAKILGDDSSTLRIVVLGGDGTVNEVLQGLPSFEHVLLGYVPTGSSNDLARDLGIPKDPKEALLRILSAEGDDSRIHLMDRGIMTTKNMTKSFVISCGIGFDAAVCEAILRSNFKHTLNKFKLGKLTYLGTALAQLMTAKKASLELYLDDATEPIYVRKIIFTAAMNHRYEGGGFKFCPDADDADGILDVCVAGNIPKLIVPFCLPTAFWGKHFIIPGIDHYTARKIRIKTEIPLWLHTDGEVHAKTNSVEITCKKQDIRFII